MLRDVAADRAPRLRSCGSGASAAPCAQPRSQGAVPDGRQHRDRSSGVPRHHEARYASAWRTARRSTARCSNRRALCFAGQAASSPATAAISVIVRGHARDGQCRKCVNWNNPLCITLQITGFITTRSHYITATHPDLCIYNEAVICTHDVFVL